MWTTVAQIAPDTTVVSFSTLTLGLVGTVSFLLLVGGIALAYFRRKMLGFGILGGVLGLVGLGLLLPSMLIGQVSFSPKSVRQQAGFVWSPIIMGFDFEGVSRVIIFRQRRNRGRNPNQMETMIAVFDQQGARRDFKPGDLWNAYMDLMTQRLKTAGIKVVDLRTNDSPTTTTDSN
jgi:hypothetical protein